MCECTDIIKVPDTWMQSKVQNSVPNYMIKLFSKLEKEKGKGTGEAYYRSIFASEGKTFN